MLALALDSNSHCTPPAYADWSSSVSARPDFLAAAAAALSLAVGVSFATQPSLIAKKDSSTRLTPVNVGETVPDTTFDEPPRVLKQVRAKFPRPWRLNGYEGFVLVNLLIDSTGHVSQAKVELRAPADIDSAVIQAARRWVFLPARKRGRPVATRWHISVELRHPRSGELASRRNARCRERSSGQYKHASSRRPMRPRATPLDGLHRILRF